MRPRRSDRSTHVTLWASKIPLGLHDISNNDNNNHPHLTPNDNPDKMGDADITASRCVQTSPNYSDQEGQIF